jgi:trimeric autotransporter adhesin
VADAASPAGMVVAWGSNGFDQTNVPPGLSNVVAVAGGGWHSLALQSNGTVVAWGYNGDGEATVPPGLSNVVVVAGGGEHSLALQSNGTVVAWGNNEFGQTNVPSGLNNVRAIAGGYYHSLALQRSGTVVAWGYNSDGETTVPAAAANVAAIGAGYAHSMALRSNGTVVAWGANYFGQTNIPPGLSNVVAIAGGAWHNLALRSNGTVVAWGDNSYGQTNIPPGLSNVMAIAGCGYHSLAVQSNGTVVAWGDNSYGQTNIPPGLSSVVAIAGGDEHSLAITLGPFILSEPPPAISLALHAGTNLSLAVSGLIPFTCQWSFNGLPIAGATNTSLVITNFDLTKAGAYSAALTNRFGYVTTATAVRLTNSPAVLVDGIDVGGGAVSRVDSSQVTMSSAFSTNAPIYYTLDGSNPDFTALPYSSAFTLTNSATIRAIAYNSSYTDWAEAAPIYVQVWPTYSLSVNTSGSGSVSVSPAAYSGTNLYLSNTVVTLTATPSNGWLFVRWKGDITATNVTTNVTTVVIDQPRDVQALFQVSTTYPLSAGTPGGGSVGVSPAPYSGSNLYLSDTVVTLTATPSNGWSFIRWTGDSTATTNVTTVVMDQPRTVQAVFGTSITLFTNGNGQVLLSPPTGPYALGSTVQVTALPSQGYYFFGWSGAASGFANPWLFTVTNASEITALFGALKSNQVSLTVLPNGNGTVAIDPARNVYTNGDSVTLTAAPATDCVFTGWSGDASGKSNPLVLLLNTNKLITANFAVAPPPVFQPVVLAAGSLTLAWSAITGLTYQLQYTTNFSQANWSNLGSATVATDSMMSASDSTGPDGQRFYRVVLLP